MKIRTLILACGVVAGVAGMVLWIVSRGKPQTSADSGVGQNDFPSAASGVSSSRAPLAAAQSPRNASTGFAANPAKLDPWQPRWWPQPLEQPEFAQFAEWCRRYVNAPDADAKAALEAEGVRLAGARRVALKALIQSDPETALAMAVPVGLRRLLPEQASALLETRESARGALEVLAALPEPGKEGEVVPVFRVARIGEKAYDAYVYGRRLGEPTRFHVPFYGLAVDQMMAVAENPARLLEPEEAAEVQTLASEAICSVSGNVATINNQPTPVELAGNILVLCGPAHLQALNEREVAAAGGTAPNGGTAESGDVEASAWTEGQKKLLIIRVDFPDLTGVSLTDSGCTNLINSLNSFYSEMSYGRSSFAGPSSGSTYTPVFRMPSSAPYYGTNNYYDRLRSDARNAATAAGYVLGNYNLDVICFGAVPGWGWGGLGYVGAAGAWLRNSFSTGVAGHELGHNFGLNHANYWDTGGQSIIGPGSSSEYGDSFDTMGSASAGNNHFNTRYKNYLNWITSSEVVTVTNGGTYRISTHDSTNTTGIRAMKVIRSASTNYWVELRQKFTSNPWLMSGLSIRRAQNGNQRSELLDMTPASVAGKNDSALVLGRTFTDSVAGIHITPIRKAGTSPESVDVVVNFGAFANNRQPMVVVSASTNAAATGAIITFTASASDADGDTLAYFWDFGDGQFGTNGVAASKSWSTAGDYVVQCWVTDMKGGVASDSIVVRIGSPSTYRISGRVTVDGYPIQGVRVSVSTTRMTWTDSDGTYTLVGLPAGTYTLSANRYGYSFTNLNFTNPVTLGPDFVGADFFSGSTDRYVNLTSPVNNATFPAPASVNLAATASAGVGRTISRVEFFRGTQRLGESTQSPYAMSWNGVTNGAYALSARATDNTGVILTSATVNITVTLQPPSITTQPQSQTVSAGGTATFSVAATGSAPLTYQWRFGNVPLAGQISPSMSTINVQTNDAGSYTVVVSNSAGAVTSAVATLTVPSPPYITSHPQSQSVMSGADVSFSVAAVGAGTLTYQWRFNGANLSGGAAKNANYNLNNVQSSKAGAYTVVVGNASGSVTSAVATLVVNAPVSILSQPQSLVVYAGSNAAFNVVAAGAAPLSCEWRRNGVVLPGATSGTLSLAGVQVTNAGNYTVRISNPINTVTSLVATLTVRSAAVSNQVRIVAVRELPNRQVELTITGPAHDRYQIEASTNLAAWSYAGSTTNVTGTVLFIDAAAATQPRRFYRVQVVP